MHLNHLREHDVIFDLLLIELMSEEDEEERE